MKVAIIVFVVLSLLGSMMWMMPSKREKFQARLRLKARQEGFQVQLVHLTAPRAQGELEAVSNNIPAYRLNRQEHTNAEHPPTLPWQVFRVDALANTGLPAGWSWKLGERQLTDTQLESLVAVINQLPADVLALESSPVQVSAFWREGQEQDLAVIKQALQQLITAAL